MKNKKILFLVEGIKTEKNNIKNIAKNIFHLFDENYEIVAYETSIYELYEKLAEDPMLSLVGLLRSMGKISLNERELSKQAFSQIYLVFDFDCQYQKYSDNIIRKLLNYFDDETENGKLYINYPMFEAAFYLDDFVNPKEVFAYQKVDECTGRIFKKKVREISCFGKRNHLDFTLSRTIDVLQCIKWNYIRQKEITGKEEIDYKKILEKQIELKNSSDHKIMILSTFILMTVDYNPKILNVVSEKLGLIL